VYAAVDCFRETTIGQWSIHAVTHLAQHAIGQISLRRAAELCKRRFRRGANNKQQGFVAACLRADVPITSELLRESRDPLFARAVNDCDIEFDFAFVLESVEKILKPVLRVGVDDVSEITDVTTRRGQFW
jgi:hypothetical protein